MQYMYKNEQSNLTDSTIMDIRKMAEQKSYSTIADYYGIGKSTVSDIVNGKTWTHVPEAKPIKGYKSYMIYPDGRVYCTKANKFMSPVYTKAEGAKVVLSANGKRKSIRVANLVAQAFHNSNKSNVAFIDGNRHNVHFTNIKVK